MFERDDFVDPFSSAGPVDVRNARRRARRFVASKPG